MDTRSTVARVNSMSTRVSLKDGTFPPQLDVPLLLFLLLLWWGFAKSKFLFNAILSTCLSGLHQSNEQLQSNKSASLPLMLVGGVGKSLVELFWLGVVGTGRANHVYPNPLSRRGSNLRVWFRVWWGLLIVSVMLGGSGQGDGGER